MGLDALETSVLTMAVISLLACIVIFFKFLTSHKKINFAEPKSMVLFLTMADFALACLSIFEILTPECKSRSSCVFYSYIRQYVTLCSFFWTAAMCHASYASIQNFFVVWTRLSVDHNDDAVQRANYVTSIMTKYHLVCWVSPLVLSSIKLFSVCRYASVGNCGMYVGSVQDEIWVTCLGYLIPFYGITLYILYVLTFLFRTMRRIAFKDGASVSLQRYW